MTARCASARRHVNRGNDVSDSRTRHAVEDAAKLSEEKIAPAWLASMRRKFPQGKEIRRGGIRWRIKDYSAEGVILKEVGGTTEQIISPNALFE